MSKCPRARLHPPPPPPLTAVACTHSSTHFNPLTALPISPTTPPTPYLHSRIDCLSAPSPSSFHVCINSEVPVVEKFTQRPKHFPPDIPVSPQLIACVYCAVCPHHLTSLLSCVCVCVFVCVRVRVCVCVCVCTCASAECGVQAGSHQHRSAIHPFPPASWRECLSLQHNSAL